MISSRYIEPITEYVFAHYSKRFDDDSGLKSVEIKITNTKKQINECTSAFIEAKNLTLRNSIETRIADLEKTLECLLSEKVKIEKTRIKKPTKQDALKIVRMFFDSDMRDKKYQKALIDVFVKKVLCWDDGLAIYFDLVD